ncbi:MAG: SUMF1/EgtB/PvdO family nonheme iron enzyme, partial [Polyangiaceae bacterium]
CPSGAYGGEMVVREASAASFCIDRTEVTNESYASWLSENPPVVFDDAVRCNVGAGLEPPGWPPPDGELSFPVVGTTWCQARAYWVANGKRLCGAMSGGNIDLEAEKAQEPYDTVEGSEWTDACSAGGEQPYAYGASLDEGRCGGGADAMAAGSQPACDGAIDGLQDMVGNVPEWVGECILAPFVEGDFGPRFFCLARGLANQACGVASLHDAKTVGITIGFRCCADFVD